MDSHDIMIALRGQALNTYDLDDFREVVRINIDRAYTLADVKRPELPVIYEQLVKEVEDKLWRSYGYLTSQELALVCEAGVAGELGRQTKPTAAAIFSWLAAYYGSDIRKEAVRDIRRRSNAEVKQDGPSGEDLERANWLATVRAIGYLWEEYRMEGRIREDHEDGWVAHCAFDGLAERGLVKLSAEDWESARREARSLYRQQQGIRAVGSLIGVDAPESKVKRLLVPVVFRKAVEDGVDIGAIIGEEIERFKNAS